MSADAPDENTPPPCSACRGTGRVISRLGGEEHSVTCPWCDGGGQRIPGHDAQARGGMEKGETPPDGNGGPDLAA
jgi:DnaJ-class molecular chaperone